MDYGRIVRDAWTITVRTRTLWWLGAIAAAQVVVFAVVMAGLALPMTAISRIVSTTGPLEEISAADPAGRFLATASQWLGSHLIAVTVFAVAVFSAWMVIAVVDVAAQTGIVTQADAAVESRPVSVRAGMRDGFRLWWRVVALLALAAIPSLLYLLVVAIVMTVTITVPIWLGHPPDPGTAVASNMALTPLSSAVSLIGVPLGVLVQLSVRFAVLEDVEWRPAFSSAWRLARANVAEIALTWLVVALVSLLAWVAFIAVAAACAAILGALVLGAALVFTAGDSGKAGSVAFWGTVGLGIPLFLGFQAVMFVWQSSVWTLLWRDRTGRRPAHGAGGRQADAVHVTASVTEGGL